MGEAGWETYHFKCRWKRAEPLRPRAGPCKNGMCDTAGQSSQRKRARALPEKGRGEIETRQNGKNFHGPCPLLRNTCTPLSHLQVTAPQNRTSAGFPGERAVPTPSHTLLRWFLGSSDSLLSASLGVRRGMDFRPAFPPTVGYYCSHTGQRGKKPAPNCRPAEDSGLRVCSWHSIVDSDLALCIGVYGR